jgi:hypothetical protein
MKVGQKYSFSIEGDHPSPHFIVCAIDYEQSTEIASIFIGGLNFRNDLSETGYGHEIHHAPVQVQSLLDSNPVLVSENVDIPDFHEGYQAWKEAFESGEAGCFAVPVADVVMYIVGVLND